MKKIFDKTFEINWQLKLRLKIFGLTDKSNLSSGTKGWYDNQCMVKFTVLPLNKETDKRYYTDEPLFGKKGQGLSICIDQIWCLLGSELEIFLDGIAPYLTNVVFPFLNQDDERKTF